MTPETALRVEKRLATFSGWCVSALLAFAIGTMIGIIAAWRRGRSVDVVVTPLTMFTQSFPAFFVAMLALAEGVGIVTENLFSGRFRYVDELVRMGADIRTEGHHAVVRGRPRLSGAPVRAPDIRAGAALVVAALGADGETPISDASHIARGYEDFAGKLRAVGADIEVR